MASFGRRAPGPLHSAPSAVAQQVWARSFYPRRGPWLEGTAAHRRTEESQRGTERRHVGAQARHVASVAVSRPTVAAPGEERRRGRDFGQVGKKAPQNPRQGSCCGTTRQSVSRFVGGQRYRPRTPEGVLNAIKASVRSLTMRRILSVVLASEVSRRRLRTSA